MYTQEEEGQTYICSHICFISTVCLYYLHIILSGAMEKKQILPPQSLQGSEVHFAQVTWADQGTKFAVTWFNRIQNESVITLCDVNALDCSGEEIFRRVNNQIVTFQKYYIGRKKNFLLYFAIFRRNPMVGYLINTKWFLTHCHLIQKRKILLQFFLHHF